MRVSRCCASCWFWLVLLPLLLVLALQLYFFLQIGWWVEHNPTSDQLHAAAARRAAEEEPECAAQVRMGADYERISSNLKRAIIASEDANFSDHEGVDWDALEKAYEKNTKRGKVVGGRLDHHPAAGEEPVPVGLAQLPAQGAGNGHRLHARIR